MENQPKTPCPPREEIFRHYGYPEDTPDKGMAYLCRPCNAYVGVHSGTDRPKGSLANAELRGWRKATHARFDPLWQDGPFKKRNAAYRWLSEQMELPIEQTHIGMFTVEQCKAALEIINKGVSV